MGSQTIVELRISSIVKAFWKARGQPLTKDRHSDRMMCNTLYWSHPWHDPFGSPMKVPSTMSPQEEMSGKRFFYPVRIMRSSSPTFGMPFTSMALSFMLSFSWQTMSYVELNISNVM
jgi:hypothetical protein